MKHTLATIDLGSNSFRLLIARINSSGLIQPIDEMKETVRLISGFDENNNLNEETQSNALKILHKFHDRLVGFDKSQVRVVATSAMRIAKNAKEFIQKANKILGFNIEVISGLEEARLIYLGAMHSISYSLDDRLVIDIGGGSTEFIIGSGYTPKIMESITIGCLSFTNRYFIDNKLTNNNFNNAILSAKVKIQSMEHLLKNNKWYSSIATSGTAKAINSIIEQYKLGNGITIDALYSVKDLLLQFKTIDKIKINIIKPDRLIVLAGGLAILIAIMEELAIKEILVVSGALREGVMYDLLGRDSNNDCRELTIHNLRQLYNLDIVQGNNVASFAKYIFEQLSNDHELNSLLDWSCQLYELGMIISHNDYHKHGAYILEYADLSGFSKLEQGTLSDLVRLHRGGIIKGLNYILSRRVIKDEFIYAIFAFRLSVILHRSRNNININSCCVSFDIDKSIYIKIDNILAQNNLIMHSLNEEIKQWQEFGIIIRLSTL